MTKWILSWRAWALALCLLWGCYFVPSWRTTDFGFSWRGVLADALVCVFFVAPITALTSMGLPWRRVGLRVLAVCVCSMLVAEVFAGAQELFVMGSYGQDPGRQIFVGRWPPYGDHHIGYSPGYGWFGGD
jgi:hypothetical protein